MWKVAVILVCFCSAVLCDEDRSLRDSYVVALDNSHKIALVDGNRNAREDYSDYHPSYNPAPDFNGPSGHYAEPPSTSYGTPIQSTYGAPPPASYGPPPPTAYGPPKPMYGPPPPTGYGPPVHGTPYFSPETWLFNKLKLKFNIYTIAKILLKIVIFKKIIKFIALICLLLFIPTLKPATEENGDNGDDSFRSLESEYDNRLNEVTRVVHSAIKSFKKKSEKCAEGSGFTCRLNRMFDEVDEEYPVKKILQLYVPALPAINDDYRKYQGEKTSNKVGDNGNVADKTE